MIGFHIIRSLLKSWVSPQCPGALILLYHRVASLETDPQLLAVTPAHFTEHLAILRRMRFQILSLEEMVARMAEGRPLPRRGVVLTFDDGYADILHQAKPLLEMAEIPASVFITTRYTDSMAEFWWDDLERILLHPHSLPDTLTLTIGPETCTWQLAEAAQYTPEIAAAHSSWHVLRHDDPTTRHTIYRALCRRLHGLAMTERQQVLDQLVSWAQLSPQGRDSHRALRTEEIRQLANSGHITIGAHSHSHVSLAALPPAQQSEDIETNHRQLEKILKAPVTTFSYPFGSRGDYTPETVACLQDNGFLCACSNFPGVVRKATDRYRLPRFLVRNWDGKTFTRHLQAFWQTL